MAMTMRENMMAIYEHRQPDYYGNLREALRFVPDPITTEYEIPNDGKEHKDIWGTTFIFLPDAPGPHPHITPENAVIKDIEHWKDSLKVPDLSKLDFTKAAKGAKQIDRDEYFAAFMCTVGLFERSHHLMGFEAALINYLEYPDEMAELLRVITEHKKDYIRLVAKYCHPDIIFYHDDWGLKKNIFLPPGVWREIIKPLQKEIADTIHECGMIYMHHADCYCQPLVEDMIEIGVDIWQGVIPQNDIVEIQRITKGKLAMVGGIDGPKIDLEDVPEEAVRAEVRRTIDTYCPAGRFFPSPTNARLFVDKNNQILLDELHKYGREYAQKHPII